MYGRISQTRRPYDHLEPRIPFPGFGVFQPLSFGDLGRYLGLFFQQRFCQSTNCDTGL